MVNIKFQRYYSLIKHRVHKVLLVASPYDRFVLEEDAHLMEQVLADFSKFETSAVPRFNAAGSGTEALEALHQEEYDLVLLVTGLLKLDFDAFCRKVRESSKNGSVPLVVLTQKQQELSGYMQLKESGLLDAVFLWTGDAGVLLPIFKLVEDRANVVADTQAAGVQVLLFLEDSPQFYSVFLGYLYRALMEQSRSLYDEGVNVLHRNLLIKSRPKILHATTYEEGVALFEKHRPYVMAVLSDISLPRQGGDEARSGLEFTREVLAKERDLPVLVHSTDASFAQEAESMNALFLDKRSKTIMTEIENFLTKSLGFGPFTFKDEAGSCYGTVKDLRQMENLLRDVPSKCIEYHARRHDFSTWMKTRSEFDMARRLRSLTVKDFVDTEELRDFLIEEICQTRAMATLGVVSEFVPGNKVQAPFSRLGKGSMGGKARSIAFIYKMLTKSKLNRVGSLKIRVPRTIVLCTGFFDRFIEENNLKSVALGDSDDHTVSQHFLAAQLPRDLNLALEGLLESFQEPLAVRSSSLLEDSIHRPFAGIYHTFMIPNSSGKQGMRLRQLQDAIKLVFASVFSQQAKMYLESTGYMLEEEKMAVILQPLVGRHFGERWYPHFSGLAQSYNYYPIKPQKSEDGIVHMALGLGCQVLDGGIAFRFCPKYPQTLPQFHTPESVLHGSQREFYALSDSVTDSVELELLEESVKAYDLRVAEKDDTFWTVGSVFDVEDRRITENFNLKGPRVVTFNNILKHGGLPVAEALTTSLKMAEEGMDGPVELEFACDLGDWGADVPKEKRRIPTLYLLQLRPFVMADRSEDDRQVVIDPKNIFCKADKALGHGVYEDLCDLVYVDMEKWKSEKHTQIAAEIGRLNQQLRKEHRQFVLIGPGRWGSRDPYLGIPVSWDNISQVKVMVEASPQGYDVEPSQGTHFFLNITANHIGYVMLPAGAPEQDETACLDRAALDAIEPFQVTEHLRHLRFSKPMIIQLKGKVGKAVMGLP